MKRLSTITVRLLLPLLCALTAGCDARREVFSDAGVWVPLQVSWRKANIRPQGVSVYVFAQETGNRVALLLTNDVSGDSLTQDSFKLHVGKYNVLVINETVASHDNASFRGVERYHSFEAYIRTEPPPDNGTERIAPPMQYDPVAAQNVLAAARESELEVTYDMLSGKRERPGIWLEPTKLSFVVDVTLHVKNLRYLNDGEPVAAVTNMAEGAFPAAETANGTPITQYFTLHSRRYSDERKVDGTLTGTFVAFGVADTAERNMLLMPFRLHDGTDYYLEREITNKLRSSRTVDEHLEITLGLGTPNDPLIVIDRVPVDDASGPFKVEVDDWGENTNVDVPVK
jgi:hypothetical protein